MKGKQ